MEWATRDGPLQSAVQCATLWRGTRQWSIVNQVLVVVCFTCSTPKRAMLATEASFQLSAFHAKELLYMSEAFLQVLSEVLHEESYQANATRIRNLLMNYPVTISQKE